MTFEDLKTDFKERIDSLKQQYGGNPDCHKIVVGMLKIFAEEMAQVKKQLDAQKAASLRKGI
jgi:hypothetical protein